MPRSQTWPASASSNTPGSSGARFAAQPPKCLTTAWALRLDDAERAHLFDLAQTASPVARRPRRRNPRSWAPHASLQWTLDAITAGPAFLRNGRLDMLAANALGRAFYMDVYDMPGQPPNIARFTFLDERAHEFYPDWDAFAEVTVAILRTEAGRDPHNKDLHDLIGELSTRSREFRRLWGAHDVRHHGTGFKTFHHSVVGRHAGLRGYGTGGRTRTDTDHLHGRAGLEVRGFPAATGVLGSK